MRVKRGFLTLTMALLPALASAQQAPKTPDTSSVYCSGIVTDEAVPNDTYILSGEQSNNKIAFAQGDLVFINKGSKQGAHVGDEFLVQRPVKERLEHNWFKWQSQLHRAMGQQYADLGRLRVVQVAEDVSTAEVVFSCEYMQRGDTVLPLVPRPAPPFKSEKNFDRFAPVSAKPVGMVVTTKNFGQLAGDNSIVYVNLGSTQGVKTGDYIRVFRYQGSRTETAYQTTGMAYKLYGFGSAPVRYTWDGLPREALGEGIVLRVSPNAATVMLTLSLRDIYVGDYVEVE